MIVDDRSIYALSTPFGKSGLAVFRISGMYALSAIKAFGCFLELKPRVATLSAIYLPEDSHTMIDRVVLIYFPAPNSFTGEDVVEIHTHGSIAVIKEVINCLSKLPFMRMAEEGEFTRIALNNDKIDLLSVEALSILLDAETSVQRNIAMRQLSGHLRMIFDTWREELLTIMYHLEAYIDFPEDDLPKDELYSMNQLVDELKSKISTHLSLSEKSNDIMKGIEIAITGIPNVGKSTLINLLSNNDIALVSDIPGTTRDVLKAQLEIKGFPIILIDTAGLRENVTDPIEKLGIKKAIDAVKKSVLQIIVIDPTVELKNQFAQFRKGAELYKENSIFVINKVDLLESTTVDFIIEFLQQEIEHATHILPLSCRLLDNNRIIELVEIIGSLLSSEYMIGNNGCESIAFTHRQQEHMRDCLKYLNCFGLDKPLEVGAYYIRESAKSLENLIGGIELEEILDRIFSNFCIGK